MTFLIFEEVATADSAVLRPTGNLFKLAGYNLLYRAWERLDRPLNRGWHVSHGDLLDLYFGANPRPNGPRLIIDFHPTSTGRIGLIKPVDVYAYTWGDGARAVWTPLMLRLRDVFYEEYEQVLSPEDKAAILAGIPTDFVGQESVEFLYLNGDDGGWNWGRNGMTNAAFLHGDARTYFRQFF
jgi:hypothetical protein